MEKQELEDRVPDPEWFFRNANHKHFPWSILGLDSPYYGPLHSYLCSLCSKYEKDSKIRDYLASRPTWRSLEKFANNPMDEEKNWFIVKIYQYCDRYYKLRESERRNVSDATVGFMEEIPPFKKEFTERLNTLYHQGRINLKLEMTKFKVNK